MGEGEWSSSEAQGHNFSSRAKTNCGGFTCTLGGIPSSEEEGGVGRV
jgi:hypothetical protein